jgi:hypothetical protein
VKGRPISNSELWIDLIGKNSGRKSEFKERNKLVLVLMNHCGIRPIELCLITNQLLISSTGLLNELFIMPESISFDGNERPIPLCNDVVKDAIESYLSWLKAKGLNTHPNNSYLGFNPNLPLCVNDNYKEFGLQHRVKKVDVSKMLLPIAMNKLIDSLIIKAGLNDCGVDRTSFIKTFVIEGYRSGLSVNDLIIIGGMSDTTVKTYLAADLAQYSPITEWFIERGIRNQKKLESLRKMRRFKI